MAQGLHPAYLRVGGTAADLVVFDEDVGEERHDYDFCLLSQIDALSWFGVSKNFSKKRLPTLFMSSKELGISIVVDLVIISLTQDCVI